MEDPLPSLKSKTCPVLGCRTYRCGFELLVYTVQDGPVTRMLLPAETGQGRILPTSFQRPSLQWMENVHDWVASRQLVGVWKSCPGIMLRVNVCRQLQVTSELKTGVLDTWFSSALWPFSTMRPDGRLRRLQALPTSTG